MTTKTPRERTAKKNAPKVGPLRVKRLRREVQQLSLKARLQMLEGLQGGLIVEAAEGLRFSARSLSEFKRVVKAKTWDEPIVAWVRSFSPTDVFYDIGANVGAFSLLAAALHGPRLRVFAFEPGFESFEALTRNIFLNGLDRLITPFQVALFDRTGLQPFNYYSMGVGSARHAVGATVDYTGQAFAPQAVQPVLAFRLDDLIEQFDLPRPTRIKLDVDGTEAQVVAGAARTLEAGPCELCLEVTERTPGDRQVAALTEWLTAHGFHARQRIDHGDPARPHPHTFDLLFARQ